MFTSIRAKLNLLMGIFIFCLLFSIYEGSRLIDSGKTISFIDSGTALFSMICSVSKAAFRA